MRPLVVVGQCVSNYERLVSLLNLHVSSIVRA